MPLVTPKSELEQDLAEKDAGVLRVATAYHHAATIQKEENGKFWALPTERLLALMNADIPLTLATFGANTAIGVPTNAMLDAVAAPGLPNRAPVEPGRTDIIFNGTEFVVAPPVQGESPMTPEELDDGPPL